MVPQLDNSSRTDVPIRTCIGCRKRAAKRELLRIVAGSDAADQEGKTGSWFVVPDPDCTALGRGAHLHPTAECLALAERRRAFARALRHSTEARGTLSLEWLRKHLGQTDQEPTAPTKNGSTSS